MDNEQTPPFEGAAYQERYQHFLGETAKIDWPSLQRYYARGQLILVNPDLDLVDIAVRIALDDTETISGYLERTLLQKPDDDMAKQWLVGGESFWAVVAAPWVLIQSVDDRTP